MTGTTFYALADFINNDVNSEKCVSYNYLFSVTRYYGFYCPMFTGSISLTGSTIKARSFNFFLTESIPAGTYGGWSSRNGLMQSFYEDVQIATLTTGAITLPTDY